MIKLLIILLLLTGCAYDYFPQVERQSVTLIRKEEKWRGENRQIAQYWQLDNRAGIVFFELLHLGDTGSFIGTRAIILNRR